MLPHWPTARSDLPTLHGYDDRGSTPSTTSTLARASSALPHSDGGACRRVLSVQLTRSPGNPLGGVGRRPKEHLAFKGGGMQIARPALRIRTHRQREQNLTRASMLAAQAV